MAMPSLAAIWWRCTVGGELLCEPHGGGRLNQSGSGGRILAATVAERRASLRDVEAPDRAGRDP
jgi:hypothetical protein